MKKTLQVAMICMATYTSKIEVPEDVTLEEAIEYAKKNLELIPVDEMNWINDIEVDEENCCFLDEEE